MEFYLEKLRLGDRLSWLARATIPLSEQSCLFVENWQSIQKKRWTKFNDTESVEGRTCELIVKSQNFCTLKMLESCDEAKNHQEMVKKFPHWHGTSFYSGKARIARTIKINSGAASCTKCWTFSLEVGSRRGEANFSDEIIGVLCSFKAGLQLLPIPIVGERHQDFPSRKVIIKGLTVATIWHEKEKRHDLREAPKCLVGWWRSGCDVECGSQLLKGGSDYGVSFRHHGQSCLRGCAFGSAHSKSIYWRNSSVAFVLIINR